MTHELLFLLLAITTSSSPALAGDPDIISDFLLPQNLSAADIDGNFFTFSGMRAAINPGEPTNFTVLKASAAEFPALAGQSVSYAVLVYPRDSVNPPHTHPRAAELLFLLAGVVDVGFVDTAGNLYTQRLQPGDMFVFPKGLVHYQYCTGQSPALAVSAFGSATPGTVSIPKAVFSSGIDGDVLAKSFKTDVATVEKISAGLAPKP